MEKTKVVCGFVKYNNKILITQRGDERNYGKWEFPGGKVKVGEDDFFSIKRELIEELNLKVTHIKKKSSYNYKSFNLIFIECSCSDPTSIKLTEHLSYKWIQSDQLLNYDFLDGDKKFVSELK